MNWADYVILAVLFISVLIGLARGLISEVLSLVIWVSAFWLAWLFGPEVARHFEGSVSLPTARYAIGNDTGPMHLIAAAGIPAVVLFSAASDPALCAPRGPTGGATVTVLRAPALGDLDEPTVARALELV